MTIASLPFLGFAALVALIYTVVPGLRYRQAAMLLANLCFLGTFISMPLAALPFAGFMLASYAALRLIMARRAGRGYVVILIAIIALFFWLKRYSFLPTASFLPFSYSTIGLSYIFFRTLHLLIDAHDGAFETLEVGSRAPGRVGLVAFLNYTLNFTTLVSGPIQLFPDYAGDHLRRELPSFGWDDFGVAIERIAIGMFKVIVLAAILNAMHHNTLAALPTASSLGERVGEGLLLSVGYTLYLYCNFSGYTDIVIGAARLGRLHLPENFDYPFSATSFIDFWARWHMTLSNWLKIYVYNPLVLGLMTRFPSPRLQSLHGIVAFFVTFFLIGLWHGQTSVFAAYGVLLGLGVSINKLHQITLTGRLGRKRYRALAARRWYQTVGRGLTFTYFTLSLLCFWGSWPEIFMVLGSLGLAGCIVLVLAMILVAGLALALVEAVRGAVQNQSILGSRYVRTVWTTALATIAIVALTLMASPAPDIVYKTF